jgi:AcrR family transcriptional regulator
MARKKLYIENEVLEKAMLSFWERGYKRVTTRELAEAMGINQFSVYASFESKENLFGKALEYYFDTNVEQKMLLPLSVKNPNLDDLRQFFEQFVDISAAGYPRGCLVCNTMVEAFGMNDQVDAIIHRYQHVMKDSFQKVVRTTYPRAEENIVHKKAEFLFGALLGLIMQNRIGIDGEPIQNYINEIMKVVSTIEEGKQR